MSGSRGSAVLHTRKYVDRLIAIDGRSLDRTAEMAALTGTEVRHEVNRCKGAELKIGFEVLDVAESPTNFTIETKRQENGVNVHTCIIFNSNIIINFVWRRCI